MIGVDGAKPWKRVGGAAGARRGAVAIFGALLWMMTGCGSNVVVPAWLNLDPSSSLQLSINGQSGGGPIPLEGGIYAVIHLDLTNPLLIKGTIDVPQIRIGANLGVLGPICVASDPSDTSVGTFTVNTLTGAETVDFPLNTVTTSIFGTTVATAQPSGFSFPLDLNVLTQVLDSGEVDGAIQLPLTIDQDFNAGNISAHAVIAALVKSSSTPPTVADPGISQGCSVPWAAQRGPMEVVLNAKRTYLRYFWDSPMSARVVSLAQIGAKPGDTLRLSPAGSFVSTSGSPGGNGIAAAFSSTATLSANPGFFGSPSRLPDAIDAGLDIVTPRTLYFGLRTDISQDFKVAPNTEVVVPSGANFLFFTPLDSYFKDNFSTDLRVQIEVNPTS